MSGWSAGNLRHVLGLFRQGRNPAAAVYDSLGADFFLAPAPGWLNLGLWEGDGSDPAEARVAVRRLVEHLAADLPVAGDVLDVGNGLGAQDPVITSVATPRSLTVVNITHSQLVAGRDRLAEAGVRPVNADGVASGSQFLPRYGFGWVNWTISVVRIAKLWTIESVGRASAALVDEDDRATQSIGLSVGQVEPGVFCVR